MIDQHLYTVFVYSISINKILVIRFMTVKVSPILNSLQKNICKINNLVGKCLQNQSNVWKNQTLE